MNSILNNSAALSALQALNMTQQALGTTQNQVSTGLKVASAADNAAYWQIGTELTSNSGIVSAANDALSQSEAVLSTATSAINSVITTIDSIQTALTQATNPGADLTAVNTSLTTLSQQLTDAVNGASFNGLNVLNGTQTAQLNFVSGFNATATGGVYNTIAFHGAGAIGRRDRGRDHDNRAAGQCRRSGPDLEIASHDEQRRHGGGLPATSTTRSSWPAMSSRLPRSATPASRPRPPILALPRPEPPRHRRRRRSDSPSPQRRRFPQARPPACSAKPEQPRWATPTTSPTSATAAGGTQVTAANAADMLSAVGVALAQVTNYSATIGATQDRMTTAGTFNTALITDYSNGISGLVNADMNQASTRLQALQTQEQLGIQSLSIANQNAQLILKLFQ